MTKKAYYLDLFEGITLIDTEYMRPGVAASYLVNEKNEAVFIETGTSLGIPLLLNVLEEKSIPREKVTYVIVSHVHLDHAGGSGELMRYLPNARLVVHPKGARHLIDPTKLISSTASVYGKAEMLRLYGEIIPIPEDRVIEAEDGFELKIDQRSLRIVDTPGHARHHFCVWDEKSQGLFTGDTFGISYREFDTENGAFLFPTTTPTQFDPLMFHQSLDRLMKYNPQRIYLTHFGVIQNVEIMVNDLRSRLDTFVRLAKSVANTGEKRHRLLRDLLHKEFLKELKEHGVTLEEKFILEILENDFELNSQGLEVWLDRIEKA